MKIILSLLVLFLLTYTAHAQYDWGDTDNDWGDADETYLGKLSNNKYDLDSISNPYGQYGSEYSLNSVNNPYGKYGSEYSPISSKNPYAIDTPKIYSQDGKYLGKYSSNEYDPDSISNPYSKYGSKYSPDSINNPYGVYGSKYSPQSPNNPYAVDTPKIYYTAPKTYNYTTPTLKNTLPQETSPTFDWGIYKSLNSDKTKAQNQNKLRVIPKSGYGNENIILDNTDTDYDKVYVPGYYKKDGTYIRGYYRSKKK